MEAAVVIANKAGIHARPASIMVKEAMKFKSKVKLTAKGKTIDAKSILMIMSLGLVKGTEVVISAEGEDDAAAVQALQRLIESKFDEE